MNKWFNERSIFYVSQNCRFTPYVLLKCCYSFLHVCRSLRHWCGRRIWSPVDQIGKILGFQFQCLSWPCFSLVFPLFKCVSICCMTYYFYLELLMPTALKTMSIFVFMRVVDGGLRRVCGSKCSLGLLFFFHCSTTWLPFMTQVTWASTICDHFSY